MFLEIMERTVEYKDEHYTVSVPLLDSLIDRPNNRSQAEHNLALFKKRFERDKFEFMASIKNSWQILYKKDMQEGFTTVIDSGKKQMVLATSWRLPSS